MIEFCLVTKSSLLREEQVTFVAGKEQSLWPCILCSSHPSDLHPCDPVFICLAVKFFISINPIFWSLFFLLYVFHLENDL